MTQAGGETLSDTRADPVPRAGRTRFALGCPAPRHRPERRPD
jgi:hypothetical protein